MTRCLTPRSGALRSRGATWLDGSSAGRAESCAALRSAATIGSALSALSGERVGDAVVGDVRTGSPSVTFTVRSKSSALATISALVVEHREHRRRGRQPVRSGEEPVRRPGPRAVHAPAPCARDCRARWSGPPRPQQPTLPRVRVEATDRDARPPPSTGWSAGTSSWSCAARRSTVSDRGTSASARWLVASATLTRGPSISIITSRPKDAASSSVCPMNRTPARVICSFDTGAVHSASSSPRSAALTAAVT